MCVCVLSEPTKRSVKHLAFNRGPTESIVARRRHITATTVHPMEGWRLQTVFHVTVDAYSEENPTSIVTHDTLSENSEQLTVEQDSEPPLWIGDDVATFDWNIWRHFKLLWFITNIILQNVSLYTLLYLFFSMLDNNLAYLDPVFTY